jgi:putative nucleotidyltransferase with HDIG domain
VSTGAMMTEEELARLAKAAGDIPAMPVVVERVLVLAQDPETKVQDLRHIIEVDPGLTSRLLRVANSAYYHRQREITSLNQAICTLGFKTVVSLTVASSTKGVFDGFSEVMREVRQTLWNHSLSTAFLANSLCRLAPKRLDPELCFLGGLLHDIGKLVISRNFPTKFAKIRHAVENLGADAARSEEVILGFRHEVLGAYLAREWKLPEAVETIIHWHHEPEAALQMNGECAVVALADHMATDFGWNFPMPNLPPLLASPELKTLSIAPAQLSEQRDLLGEQVGAIRAIF